MRRLLSLLTVVATCTAVRADDWPQWLGADRQGVWKETGIVEKFPKDGPKQLWEMPVGGGYSGPAVANGRVFVTDRIVDADAAQPKNAFDKDTAVKGGERVLAFDVKTGKELWKHAYPCTYRISYASGPRCTPSVDGDSVYTLGAMGDLLCLDVASGKVNWSKNFVKDFDSTPPMWGYSSNPIIDGDKVICIVGGSDGRLAMAFDKKTGDVKWKAIEFGSGDFGYAQPVIYTFDGVRTLIIWHSKAVVGLDPETGKTRWTFNYEVDKSMNASMPRKVGEDELFLTTFFRGSFLLKVTRDSAKDVWIGKAKGVAPNQTKDLSSTMSTAIVRDGYVYGICSYGELRCIEAKTGKRIWASMKATRGAMTPEKIREQEEPSETAPWNERWGNAFLIEHGDRVFFFNELGELVIAKVSPKGYEEIDRAAIIKPTNKLTGRAVVWVCPAFAEKSCFIRNDEKLIRVSLEK